MKYVAVHTYMVQRYYGIIAVAAVAAAAAAAAAVVPVQASVMG